jgi:hypothetical protein
MRLGFTGTRKGCTAAQLDALEAVLRELRPAAAVHGCCVGADEQFHYLIRALWPECRIEGQPSTLKGQRAYVGCDSLAPARSPLVRNQAIVAECELLIACPHGYEEEQRSGTWATVRHARKVGRPVKIVWPDGRIEG